MHGRASRLYKNLMRAGGNKNSGFTIIETLIVLAVSAGLALMAMLLVNGRQNKTEFQVAINNLQQQFQQIINETASGFYPNNGNTFICHGNTGPGGEPNITAPGATPAGQGANQGCIFLGKVIRLGAGIGSSSDNNTITVYPLVGNQQDISVTPPQEVSNYTLAKPVLLATGLHTHTGVPDDSTVMTLDNGLSYAGACYNATVPPCGNPITAVAFVSSLGSYTGTTLDSGSQQLNLWGFNASPTYPWSTAAAGPSFVDSADDAKLLPIASNISKASFCFKSGTTNQSGLIIVGGSGSITVTLKIFGSPTCA